MPLTFLSCGAPGVQQATIDALPPGRRVPQQVLRAARQEVPQVLLEPRYKGLHYRWVAVGRLGRSIRRFRYADVRRWAAACGRDVADLSWIVFLSFPRAPAASIGFSVAYFARTQDGWQLWFRCQPNLAPPNCSLED